MSFSHSCLWSEDPLSTLNSQPSVSSSATARSINCFSTLLSQPLCQLKLIFFYIHIAPGLYLLYITLYIQVFQDNCFQVLCFLLIGGVTGFCPSASPLTTKSEPTYKAMAPHSSTLAWKISWVEKPGRLQSMGSQRVGHDWATSLWLFTLMHWRRKWQPTPVLLPGESQGRGSLVGCHLWGRTESDTTEVT